MYSAQCTEARAEETGAPQQNVCRGVGLLAADEAETRRAADIAALGALGGRSAADSMQVPMQVPFLCLSERPQRPARSWCTSTASAPGGSLGPLGAIPAPNRPPTHQHLPRSKSYLLQLG